MYLFYPLKSIVLRFFFTNVIKRAIFAETGYLHGRRIGNGGKKTCDARIGVLCAFALVKNPGGGVTENRGDGETGRRGMGEREKGGIAHKESTSFPADKM